MKRRISFTGTENANRRNKKLTFKNNALFRSCISQINNTLIDNVENLCVLMPMYNLLEYSNNYSMTSGSLWDYYKDEINDDENEIDDNGNEINNRKRTKRKTFKYKTKLIWSTSNNISRLNPEVVIPLKHLSNF